MNASLLDSFLRWAPQWVLTYSLHSALLAAVALMAARVWLAPGARRSSALKVALFGALVSASLPWQVIGPISMSVPDGGSGAPVAVRGLAVPGLDGPQAMAQPLFTASSESDGVAAVPTAIPAATTPIDASRWALWLTAAVASVSLWLLARMALVRRRFMASLQRVPSTDVDSIALLEEWTQADNASPVHLSVARNLGSPVALSSNEICVPAGCWANLSSSDRGALLAHEYAHIQRRDPFWFTAAAAMERLFFFLPWHRILRQRLTASAEVTCDALAAQRVGSPTAVASCLAAVAEWGRGSSAGSPIPASMPAMGATSPELLDRVRALLAPGHGTPTEGLGLGAVIALVGFTCCAPSVTTGQGTQESASLQLEDHAIVVEVQPDGIATARLSKDFGELEPATVDLNSRQAKEAMEDWFIRAAANLPTMTQEELIAQGTSLPASLNIRSGAIVISASPDVELKYALYVMSMGGLVDVQIPDFRLLVDGQLHRTPLPFDGSFHPSDAAPDRVQKLDLRMDQETPLAPPSFQLSSTFAATLDVLPPTPEVEEDFFIPSPPPEPTPEEARSLSSLRALLEATVVPGKPLGATLDARHAVTFGTAGDVLQLLQEMHVERINFMGYFGR